MAEIIESRKLYGGRLFDVMLERFKIEGKIISREIVKHPGAAAILPILPDGRILLVKQYRRAVNEVLVEIPAGTLEPGEEPKACAFRELEEETGYRAGRLERITSLALAPGYSSEIIHIYLAENLVESHAHPEEDESITLLKVGLDEAVEMIRRGEIRDAKTVAAVLLYLLERGRLNPA